MFRFIKAVYVDNLLSSGHGAAAGVGAMLAPYISYVYGPGVAKEVAILSLLGVMFLDWISGIGAAIHTKTYTSEYGINGLLRSLFLLTFPAVASFFDQFFNSPGVIFYAITVSLIYHNLKSASANAYRAGWRRWFPKKVVDSLASEIQAKAERAMKSKKGG